MSPNMILTTYYPALQAFRYEFDMLSHCREAHYDRWCAPCKRMFQNENNLRQHLGSATHCPANIVCPMKGCGRSFISTAALVLHLESGTCASGMTREMVDRLVKKYDKHGVITDPSRLIQGSGTSSPQVTRTWATDRAWNGQAYECYLCHKTFRSLSALNAHLGSPVHGDKLYRCPRGFGGCGIEFRTLSAFCQHVERGQCGVHRFASQLRNVIDGVTKSGRLLTGG
uniref:C2H2-type domain-containing protein n=1 Tax=Ganoderma boninense TaxID=34458 RepID=A0A5K1JVJ1_9APHY|nr:C2H2-type domain-containing protein [Ganoderma boninense]